MHIKLGQKDNKTKQFLEVKIGIPVSKILEEMNRLDINKRSSEEKCDRSMNRLKKTLNINNYIKNLR